MDRQAIRDTNSLDVFLMLIENTEYEKLYQEHLRKRGTDKWRAMRAVQLSMDVLPQDDEKPIEINPLSMFEGLTQRIAEVLTNTLGSDIMDDEAPCRCARCRFLRNEEVPDADLADMYRKRLRAYRMNIEQYRATGETRCKVNAVVSLGYNDDDFSQQG